MLTDLTATVRELVSFIRILIPLPLLLGFALDRCQTAAWIEHTVSIAH